MQKHKKLIKLKTNWTMCSTSMKQCRCLFESNLCFSSVVSGRKEIDVLKKSVRQINDRVVTLEKLMVDSHILLEKIQAAIQQEDRSLPESDNFVHILSRESPYIYTNEARFPVTERYIPWRVKS